MDQKLCLALGAPRWAGVRCLEMLEREHGGEDETGLQSSRSAGYRGSSRKRDTHSAAMWHLLKHLLSFRQIICNPFCWCQTCRDSSDPNSAYSLCLCLSRRVPIIPGGWCLTIITPGPPRLSHPRCSSCIMSVAELWAQWWLCIHARAQIATTRPRTLSQWEGGESVTNLCLDDGK